MNSLTHFCNQELDEIKASSTYRSPVTNKRSDGVYITRNGKKLVSFCCNDYLGLADHPEVLEAAITAIRDYGFGAASSRYITGNHPLYEKLEQLLATTKNTDDAMVFSSGYLANIGTIPALASNQDLILADKLSHACMIDGIKLSGAKYMRFRHNDLAHLQTLLKKHRNNYRNCLILTETVFSMDGDIAPIEVIAELSNNYGCWLMSDDAHGFGIVKHEVADDIPYIQMGTLSKAVGAYGGYVCGSRSLIEYLRNTARSAIYNTALPPATIAAALKAIELINEHPKLGENALKNARLFTEIVELEKAESTIVPVIIGDNKKALALTEILEEKGFLVSAIRPPTVPPNTARLRFTFSSLHTKQDISEMAQYVRQYIE